MSSPYETDFAAGVLRGLQGKHTYEGGVAAGVIELRRRRNRAARRQRRINRLRGKA
jgi:hypothetical protein